MLLEQQADQSAAKSMSASLWLHLRYCSYCNRYGKQTLLIAEWAKAAATDRASSDTALSEAAKQRMRERLAAAE